MSRLAPLPQAIERLHQKMDKLLSLLNRCLLVGTLMSVIFLIGLVPAYLLLSHPENHLQTEAFEINQGAALRLQHREIAKDPLWDGTLSGMSMGYIYLKGIPVVGVVIGPTLGGLVGYTLDRRI